MIKLTEDKLSRMFDIFNEEYFDGNIKKCRFLITSSKSYFGQYTPSKQMITISTAWIRSEEDYWNTLIHEMCHAYARQKYGLYIHAHGYEWKEIAAMVNHKMKGKYGTIQRVGGAKGVALIRGEKEYKFVVFTDFKGRLSFAKYSNDDYPDSLVNRKCVKPLTDVYLVVSNDPLMCSTRLRKNGRILHWALANDTIENILKKCRVVNKQFVLTLNKAA